MNYAEEIKAQVSMRQVADLYGLKVNRAGFMRCPFHNEKTASLKVYEGARGYHCFGCGRTGDVIGFVREMDGATFSEACEKLNNAFHLGLPLYGKPSKRLIEAQAQRAYERRKMRREAETRLRGAETAFWEAYDAWLISLLTVEKMAPKRQLEALTDEYIDAVLDMDLAEEKLEAAEVAWYEAEKGR